jgi:hypothetical protein
MSSDKRKSIGMTWDPNEVGNYHNLICQILIPHDLTGQIQAQGCHEGNKERNQACAQAKTL